MNYNEQEMLFVSEEELIELQHKIPANIQMKMNNILKNCTDEMADIEKTLIQLEIDIDGLKKMDIYGLYLFTRDFYYLIKRVQAPYILVEKCKALALTPEYQNYYIKACITIEKIMNFMSYCEVEKRTRRGVCDDGLNIKQQNEALRSSIDYILNELELFSKIDERMVTKVIENLKDRPIHIIKKLLKNSDLNYTNNSGSRYVLFEQLILAPFKLRKFRENAIYEKKLLENIINTKKSLSSKYTEYDIQENNQEEELLLKMDSLKQVLKNQAITYIEVLFFELYSIDPKYLKRFLKEFFTETTDKSKTNFMKNTYPYLTYIEINGCCFLKEDLPYPLNLIEKIV